ncbi:MAG: mutarotase [Ignavibacteriae bacterium]|nr:mutarotase [Ignavibacteriota bacterium]
MKLTEHYNNLFSDFVNKLKFSNVEVDNQLFSKADNRYGITLVIVPPEIVKQNIQQFVSELKIIEPEQYYYRNSDIHITVMSVISCYQNFSLDKIKIEDYLEVIKKSLINIKNFSIDFNGITGTQSAIMVQGFPSNNYLNILRDNLRKEFASTNLEQSLDKRYAIQTAHSTVVRFRNEIQHKEKFLQILEKYRNHEFGKFDVEEIIFVANDWYQKKEKVQILEKLTLEK